MPRVERSKQVAEVLLVDVLEQGRRTRGMGPKEVSRPKGALARLRGLRPIVYFDVEAKTMPKGVWIQG